MSPRPLSGNNFNPSYKPKYDENVFWAQNAKYGHSGPDPPKIRNFEIFLFDDDLDGNADRAEIDKDDDGTSDLMAYDYDQDGTWDKYKEIS